MIILLRNRLNYALTGREAGLIVVERKVLVDGKVRTDPNFPAGFMGMYRSPLALLSLSLSLSRVHERELHCCLSSLQFTYWSTLSHRYFVDDVDVITIPATNEHFRLLYDTKGRFTVHRIKPQEADVCVPTAYSTLIASINRSINRSDWISFPFPTVQVGQGQAR